MIGIISGTVSLQDTLVSVPMERVTKVNAFGRAELLCSDTIAFIARHGYDPARYILPHLINHKANLQALRDLAVSEVLGICSTGSLRNDFRPGTIVIPDDFIMLSPYEPAITGKSAHLTPTIDTVVRGRCIEAARRAGCPCAEKGTYWQTPGPRLESRAEIRMMSAFADIVGMTMASEAIAAQELDLPYAAICSVDNYANGIENLALKMEEISMNAAHNRDTICQIIGRYIDDEGGT